MKRVIEIDEDMFNILRNAEDMDCEVSAEAHIINKSLSLNGLLDMIRAEIDYVYENLDGYDPDSLGTLISKVDEIIDKYKESEDK